MKAGLKKSPNPAFEFFVAISVHSNVHIFPFFWMCWPFRVNTWMWAICICDTSTVCNTFLSAYQQTADITRRQNVSCANSGLEGLAHTSKQRIYLIYVTKWVLRLVCGCQVFCEDLKSNSVFKLFNLTWCYEGMKVMNLGSVNSNGNLSVMLKSGIFKTLM